MYKKGLVDKVFTKANAKKLKGGHIVIPDGYTKIADGAFLGREDIVTVTPPETLREIGDSAFENCKSLTGFDFSRTLGMVTVFPPPQPVGAAGIVYTPPPEKLSPGDYRFGLKLIGRRAFAGCAKLAGKVVIPGGVQKMTIGEGAFSGCERITGVTLQKTGTQEIEIGEWAFAGCSVLNSFDIETKSKTRADNNQLSDARIVPLPEGITIGRLSLSRRAFGGCVNLTDIQIPETLTDMDINAFAGCPALSGETRQMLARINPDCVLA